MGGQKGSATLREGTGLVYENDEALQRIKLAGESVLAGEGKYVVRIVYGAGEGVYAVEGVSGAENVSTSVASGIYGAGEGVYIVEGVSGAENVFASKDELSGERPEAPEAQPMPPTEYEHLTRLMDAKVSSIEKSLDTRVGAIEKIIDARMGQINTGVEALRSERAIHRYIMFAVLLALLGGFYSIWQIIESKETSSIIQAGNTRDQMRADKSELTSRINGLKGDMQLQALDTRTGISKLSKETEVVREDIKGLLKRLEGLDTREKPGSE